MIEFRELQKHHIETKPPKLDISRPDRKFHMTDREMGIKKGGIYGHK